MNKIKKKQKKKTKDANRCKTMACFRMLIYESYLAFNTLAQFFSPKAKCSFCPQNIRDSFCYNRK